MPHVGPVYGPFNPVNASVFRQIMKTCQSLRRQIIEDFQVIVNFVANSVYVFITESYNTSDKFGTHIKIQKGEIMIFRQIMKTCQSLRRQNIEDFQVIDNFVTNSVYVFITESYNTSDKFGTHIKSIQKGEIMILRQILKTCQSLQRHKTEYFHAIETFFCNQDI